MKWRDLINNGCPDCGGSYDQLCINPIIVCSTCGWAILEEEVEGWVYGIEECRVCGYKGAFVAPEICDLDYMECANCGNMTCEAV
jgi:DNA-directed RNA polymerase subunit RPC12/RpoP